MAIVHLPTSDGGALESILSQARPTLLVRNGSVQLDAAGGLWADRITRHRIVLEQALRGVGRIETDGGPQDFVGTAFIVDPARAVTASFVAEALVQHRQSGGPSAARRKPLEGVWLNLKAEYGSEASERIAVRDVQLVHPYWGFAFLILDEQAKPERVLSLSAKQSEAELHNRDICVLGYPAQDVRNDHDAMTAIFGDIYDVKRLMPGKITGLARWGIEQSIVLNHDATTTGGTSGAPLIDIATGAVLGLQVGGRYGVSNYAMPAWEITRDPQWWARSTREETEGTTGAAEAARQSIGASDAEAPILTFEEVLTLYKELTRIGANDEARISTLLLGLPKEYVGALPQSGKSPSEKLLAVLHGINEIGGRIGEHSAFYYVFKNAEQMRSWDSAWAKTMQEMVAMLLQRQAKRGDRS